MAKEITLSTGITLRNYLANVFADVEMCLENALADGRVLGADLAFSEIERTLGEVREAAKVVRQQALHPAETATATPSATESATEVGDGVPKGL